MKTHEFYLITGLSGAGKSHALQAFEDMGYYCVDNLPVQLLDQFISLCKNHPENRPVAFILDVREKVFIERFQDIVEKFEEHEVELEIIFLEATDRELLNRYRESRRLHPLAREGGLEDAIAREKEQLVPVRALADFVLDTTETNIHQFKRILIDLCHPDPENRLTLALVSFGFKYGSPSNLDFLFDARFLPNPHYKKKIREFNGLQPQIREFLDNCQETDEYLSKLQNFINYITKVYFNTDKTALFVGVGCTGGRHRSVYLVDKLASYYSGDKFRIVTSHRDIEL